MYAQIVTYMFEQMITDCNQSNGPSGTKQRKSRAAAVSLPADCLRPARRTSGSVRSPTASAAGGGSPAQATYPSGRTSIPGTRSRPPDRVHGQHTGRRLAPAQVRLIGVVPLFGNSVIVTSEEDETGYSGSWEAVAFGICGEGARRRCDIIFSILRLLPFVLLREAMAIRPLNKLNV